MGKKKNKTSWSSKRPKTNHESLTSQVKQQVVDSRFKLPGLVVSVGEVVEKDGGFRKSELVLLTHDYKPQLVCLEFLNAKVELLGGLARGEKIEVSFRIEGRDWEGKVLNNLIGTGLDKLSEKEVVFE
jgi:hypothetical protein